MDGNSSTGNPSAASPHTLPVDTLQPSDRISTSKEAGGQSLEILALLTSQDHQSFPGILQDPVANFQKATESLQEPKENVQKPSATPQEPTENVQKPSISLQEPAENIYRALDTDQNSPEALQFPIRDPKEEQHIFPLDLYYPPPEKPEPGSSPPPLGLNSTSQEPSMTKDQNVEVIAPPSGPGSQHSPGDPPELQPPGVSPELKLLGDPEELKPPEGSPEFHLTGDPPELHPGDLTGHHTLNGPPIAPQQGPAHAAPPSDESRLCGFLLKLGGPLKTWKQRWFCYEVQRNQLLYYRRPQDLTPLGHVGLSGATFSPLLDDDSSSSFHIHTPQRTFTLKVGSSHLVPGGPSPSPYLT